MEAFFFLWAPSVLSWFQVVIFQTWQVLLGYLGQELDEEVALDLRSSRFGGGDQCGSGGQGGLNKWQVYMNGINQ